MSEKYAMFVTLLLVGALHGTKDTESENVMVPAKQLLLKITLLPGQ